MNKILKKLECIIISSTYFKFWETNQFKFVFDESNHSKGSHIRFINNIIINLSYCEEDQIELALEHEYLHKLIDKNCGFPLFDKRSHPTKHHYIIGYMLVSEQFPEGIDLIRNDIII